jgi:hypothetical protein
MASARAAKAYARNDEDRDEGGWRQPKSDLDLAI